MMRFKYIRYSIILGILHLGIGTPSLNGQAFRNPFDFPILLSGNFGELRNNHFHSGIDFKTQGVEGKAVHAVQDGYIARISVSPWGYGHALYINHPDGTSTVYGHLQRFADSMAVYVKEQQYRQESFTVDLSLTPGQFPVRKGEVIAWSGNSGSSAGAHLHFEIRNTETEEIVDPVDYYKDRLTDKRPPKIQGVMLYPVEGRGVVNGSGKKQELKLVTAKNGKQTITGKIEAWGEIALAVKAYDYMDGTGNILGVRKVTLKVDSLTVFHSDIDRFAFAETRYLNSFIDYEEWKDNRSFYMKSFVEPGNRLRFIKSLDRGIVKIDQERTYHLTYHLEDAYGNATKLSIWIDGKKQPFHAPETTGAEYVHWKSDNRFGAKGIRLHIPAGCLYDDLYFCYSVKEDSTALAATHTLHNRTIALHRPAQLSLHLQTDTLADKQKYGIVRKQNNRLSWIGGVYRTGWIDADILDFGSYTVAHDAVCPVITPVHATAWIQHQQFTFRITDNLSGIQTYRGEIDGRFALFEMDGKNALVSYRFDKARLTRGHHTLTLTVSDACGNESVYTHPFVW
ncbi:MAG: M23 family metallopeptidase [Tannerellaceae bacterium]|jgi:hypothetical protein|nr:M23 family metallopeptidase [Tannerellaceae bacterium]